MNISHILRKIEDARIAHLRWVDRAEALVKGLPLDKNQVPLLVTDCDFGQWYLREGRVLRHLPSYEIVRAHHQRLHLIYMDIFKLMFSEEDRSNILQWLGIQRKVDISKQNKARDLLPSLQDASHDVLKSLDKLTMEFERAVKLQNKPKNHISQELDELSKELEAMGYTGKNSNE